MEFYAKDQKKWWQVVFLVGTVWCLGLLQETVWLNWIFFRIFYPLLDRDLLHKNENKLITDWGGGGRGRGGGRTKVAGGVGGIRIQEKEKSGTQEKQ